MMAPPASLFSHHPTQVSSRLFSTFREFRVSLSAGATGAGWLPWLRERVRCVHAANRVRPIGRTQSAAGYRSMKI